MFLRQKTMRLSRLWHTITLMLKKNSFEASWDAAKEAVRSEKQHDTFQEARLMKKSAKKVWQATSFFSAIKQSSVM
jgi:hypothetical protein